VLAVVGVLTVAALAVFILYGRMKLSATMKDLDKFKHSLGVDIDQKSDHFTYSQSIKGKTVYTIRAATEVQHKNGTITLEDVGIVLYGRNGDRSDRIHGRQFEYNPAAGELRAVGEVFLDLEAPPKDLAVTGASSEPRPSESSDESRLIHIKTSGLVFLEKQQAASTGERVEFETGGLTGSSLGASYDSAHGMVTLRSAVRITGIRNDRPLLLTAAHAELDRGANASGNRVTLEEAKYVSTSDSGPESAAARHAVIRLDSSGTPQHVDAQREVTLSGNGHGTLSADKLQLDLGPTGQPRNGHLFEHVAFLNDDPRHLARGRADDARFTFDEAGRLRHAEVSGGVNLEEKGGPAERHLQAARVRMEVSGGGKAPLVLRAGEATGGANGAGLAWLRLADSSVKVGDGRGSQSTDIHADTLTGQFNARSAATQLDGLDGAGHTQMQRTTRNARGVTVADDTSSGDTLRLELAPSSVPGAPRGRMELVRAAQHGGVTLVRMAARGSSARKPGAKPLANAGSLVVQHARADDAVYAARTDLTTLTGNVQVSDDASVLLADCVESDRDRGVTTATGRVRVSYLDAAKAGQGNDPVHVIAARAVSTEDDDRTVFYGTKARMWQGNSQIEAPVLEFDRNAGTLVAHGAGEPNAVRTVLMSVESVPKPGTAPVKTPASHSAAGQPGSPVRVLSESMTYTDEVRQAVFRGHVRVDDTDGTLLADEATASLAAKGAGASGAAASSSAASLMSGRLERVVGVGQVSVRQPGRIATGEKIVYTAMDGMFVLTGSKTVAPKVVDEQNGTVTGAVLRFRKDDETVFVDSDADHGRVKTQTKIKQ
jgi:lipopolysaccharide export system protein LptA